MDLHPSKKKENFVLPNSTRIQEDIQKNNNKDTTQTNMKSEDKKLKKKKTKKKNRCAHIKCNGKLKLSDMKCRCHKIYCSKHRLPETHLCSWNPKDPAEIKQYIKTSGLDQQIRFTKLEYI